MDNKQYAEIWEEANRPYFNKRIPLYTECIMRFAALLEQKVRQQQETPSKS